MIKIYPVSDEFCNSLKRALIMLDLEHDGDEDQQSGETLK